MVIYFVPYTEQCASCSETYQWMLH